MSKVRNEDIGMSVIRRVNKFYQVLSADMDEMKVIFWVPFDHDDDAKIAELNRYIKDIESSKNHPNTKKGPYEFEFGFGNPDLGGEIHTLQGLEDDDSFVLSAWFDDPNALYDLEEENSYTEDIFRVITYYLHRLKCDKGANFGESYTKGVKMNLLEAKQELREHGYTLLKEGLFGYDVDKVKDKIEQVLAVCKTNTEHFASSSDDEAITPLYIFANHLKRVLKDIEKGDDVNYNIKYFLKDKDSHYVSLYCKDDSYVDALRKAWNEDKIDTDKFQDEKSKTQFIKTTRFRKEVGAELENLGVVPLYKKATTKEVKQNLKDEYDFVVYIPLDVSKIFKD